MTKLISVLLFLVITIPASSVRASFTPVNFPSCESPDKSNLKVTYPEGDHAIVGVSGLQKGADSVYSNGGENYYQCYCPVSSHSGTQTNWMAAEGISKEDQNVLITQGWVYISNGQDWGLDNQPYLAKNLAFSCGQGSSGGSSGGSSSGSSDSGGSSGGSASAIASGQGGSVLGISSLAATSSPYTAIQILLALLAGIGMIFYGYKIQKNKK